MSAQTSFQNLNLPTSWFSISCVVVVLAISEFLRRVFTVPAGLRHLPRAPLLPLIWSFATGEVEEQRIKRILLPFANEKGEGLVLMWGLGTWIVHILDYEVAKATMHSRAFTKQAPGDPKDNLFMRFIGDENIHFVDEVRWERHSRILRTALQQTMPVEQFVTLTRTLFGLIGKGGRIGWDDLAHRFSLDAVGTTVLGHDFQALANPHSKFVEEYHGVMDAIADPLYLVIPALERWWPRHAVAKRIDDLSQSFLDVLHEKKKTPGNDVLTYMLQEHELSDKECRDNIIVFFIGGHDTTAGAITTLIYCLGLYPEIQERARQEVLSVMGSADPTMDSLNKLPYLQACVREALRFNNPSTVTIPRVSTSPQQLGKYRVPANTLIMLDMTAELHNEAIWPNHNSFDPERWMTGSAPVQKWLPFGMGARRCPAQNFSLYEQRTLTAMLLREYTWTVPADSIHRDGIKNGFSPFSISLPYNMAIDFKRRA